MGQIRKRGGVYWIRYYREGRRFEESARTAQHEKARDLLKEREGDIAKGVPVTPSLARLRFEEAAGDLLTDYQVNGRKSYIHVKGRIDRGLAPWFNGRRFASITTSDVRAYIGDRQTAGAAAATINRELAALKRMFSLAMQAGKVIRRPHIPMLREDNTRKGFFERVQFDAVRARLPKRVQGVATFAYYTGWRTVSEILPLQWHQVDFQAGVVRLDPGTTKNREGRIFVFSQLTELREALEAQDASRKALQARRKKPVITPWVFHRKNGGRIHSFRKAWQRACTDAGCPGRILHDFRRTAVRNLIRAGVPDTIAMKLTGHKTRAVFDRYDITSEEDLAEAGRKLQRLAGTIAGTIGLPEVSETQKLVRNGVVFGDPGGDRTHDPVIKSSRGRKS